MSIAFCFKYFLRVCKDYHKNDTVFLVGGSVSGILRLLSILKWKAYRAS